jgi:hypothetical protein
MASPHFFSFRWVKFLEKMHRPEIKKSWFTEREDYKKDSVNRKIA